MRPGALVEDKYSIAVLANGQSIGHVPKFLLLLIFFFLKYEGMLSKKVTGERRFSFDLPQGGIEIPADFVFKTVDTKLHKQRREKVLKELENFEKNFNFSTPNLIRFDTYFTLIISTTPSK